MDAQFFADLDLQAPRYNLGLGARPFGRQVSEMTRAMFGVFSAERPDTVIVQGDTNSVLAGVLAASKAGIRIAHVEAGLRSFDADMSEELNRVLADSLADELLAPTATSRQNLLDEGHEDARITVTGNTVVDALLAMLPPAGRPTAWSRCTARSWSTTSCACAARSTVSSAWGRAACASCSRSTRARGSSSRPSAWKGAWPACAA
jgi:UDP-N-acetylglucosamine 2-epimerase (non-hydrolysing)